MTTRVVPGTGRYGGGGGGCCISNSLPVHFPAKAHFSFTRNIDWAGLCSLSSSSPFSTRAAVGDGLMRWRSFYELLGISEEGSFEDIKRAYKQMARKYHPDVSPPDRAEEYTRRFIEVQEAYETLSDPRRRAMYDRDLARGMHLAFSARRRFDEVLEERSEWRNHWQGQVAELRRRSTHKDSGGNMSWGARMRRQRAAESSAD